MAIEERRDARKYDDPPDDKQLPLPGERALALRLAEVDKGLEIWLGQEDFVGAMSVLAGLRQPIDAFFEKVTVNTDVPELRKNRLRLLSAIRGTMNRIADFSQIEG